MPRTRIFPLHTRTFHLVFIRGHLPLLLLPSVSPHRPAVLLHPHSALCILLPLLSSSSTSLSSSLERTTRTSSWWRSRDGITCYVSYYLLLLVLSSLFRAALLVCFFNCSLLLARCFPLCSCSLHLLSTSPSAFPARISDLRAGAPSWWRSLVTLVTSLL